MWRCNVCGIYVFEGQKFCPECMRENNGGN